MIPAIIICIVCIYGLKMIFEDMELREENKRKKEHFKKYGRRLKIK